jgi:hypothetical protein
MLERILQEQAEKISRTYKISTEKAKKRLEDNLSKLPELQKIMKETKRIKDVYRTRIFKDFIKKSRKEIYYDLRTYQKGGSALESHVSTRERAPYLNQFLEQLDPFLSKASHIIDVGGGLFPLSVDFEKYKNIKTYVWLDKDENSYQKLLKFKKNNSLNNLYLYKHSLGKEPWQSYLPETVNEFDLALFLKLVPVLARQEKGLLETLSEIPANRILVTGNKEAMVKKIDIEERERKVIEKFIKNSSKVIIKQIEIPNEFGYLIE